MANKDITLKMKNGSSVTFKRNKADWWYSYPDDRNRLIEEARELIAAAQVTFKKVGVKTKDCPTWFKAANAFMKETKP